MNNPAAMHPLETDLALFPSRDLPLWKRLRIAAHLRRCAGCRAMVSSFGAAREALGQAEPELPPGIAWNDLAGEMAANIRLGLEAGECIERSPLPSRRGIRTWNLSLALSAAALLAVCVLWIRQPHTPENRPRPALSSPVAVAPAPMNAAVLEASPTGPAVQENGASMKLLVPRSSESVSVLVNLQDSVSARYVDADSGQVTISKVYYAQ